LFGFDRAARFAAAACVCQSDSNLRTNIKKQPASGPQKTRILLYLLGYEGYPPNGRERFELRHTFDETLNPTKKWRV